MEAEDCDCSLQIRDTLSTAHHSTHEAIRAGAKGLLWGTLSNNWKGSR